jgi:hypothetical protein
VLLPLPRLGNAATSAFVPLILIDLPADPVAPVEPVGPVAPVEPVAPVGPKYVPPFSQPVPLYINIDLFDKTM